MVDETTDLSNVEQLVMCLRYVDDDLDVYEEFVGLHSLESTTATVIVSTIKDILLLLNLRLEILEGNVTTEPVACPARNQV